MRDQAQAHYFKPDELATTLVSLNQHKRVDGLFLSSGIVPDASTTMEKLLATDERLRLKAGYTGYIHLKLIPGASFEYVELVVELAHRVSLNLEAPNQARLTDLAPDKEFAGSMWGRMAWADLHLEEPIEINRAPRHVLLKVPGIGPRSADRIIATLREARLRDITQLKALGVTTGWAAPYILLDGRRTPEQLRLW